MSDKLSAEDKIISNAKSVGELWEEYPASDSQYVPLWAFQALRNEKRQLEETCSGFAKDLQETIEVAAETIRDYQTLLQEVNDNCKWKRKVEAANKLVAEAQQFLEAVEERTVRTKDVLAFLNSLSECFSQEPKTEGT